MKNCFDRVSKREAYKMTGISADDVRKRVARKLGDAAEEEERTRIRMKKRLILSVVLAALFLISAAAATSYHISKLAPGNIALVQDSIQTEPVTKTLGEFEVTVHESLCDENYTYLALSLRGLTDKAKKQIMDESRENDYSWDTVLDVYVEGTGAVLLNRPRMRFEKVESLCTEDTVYMIGELTRPNPERKPIIISLYSYFMDEIYPGVKVTDTITVPFGNKIGGSFTITPNQKLTAHRTVLRNTEGAFAVKSLKEIESQVTINKVTLSQLGLRIDYTDDTRCSELDGCIFIQMSDGSIRTFNQMFTRNNSNGDLGGRDDNVYHINVIFIELQDMKNFKAIILGNTAYPLNGGKAYQVAIDQKLQPFFLPVRCEEREDYEDPKERMAVFDEYGEEYVWDEKAQTITITSSKTGNKGQVFKVGKTSRTVDFYPVKELCDKLGAGYQWDATGQKVTITYNGRTTVLPVGTSSHPMLGENNTIDIELELVESKPYASWQLIRVLGLSQMNAGTNDKMTILFP